MAQYLLIESRDPFDNFTVADDLTLAGDLAAQGNDVCVFLVQNGVMPARREAHSDVLTNLRGRGVQVLADAFSLRERGIQDGELADGVQPAPIDAVVDQMAEGRKTIWL